MNRNSDDRTEEMIDHVTNHHMTYNTPLPIIDGYVDYRAVIDNADNRSWYPTPRNASVNIPTLSVIITAVESDINVCFHSTDAWIIDILDPHIPRELNLLALMLRTSIGENYRRRVIERIIDAGGQDLLRNIIEYDERVRISESARYAAVESLTCAIIEENDARIDALIAAIPAPTHRMAIYNLIDNIYHAAEHNRYGRVIYSNGAAARVVWYIFMFMVRYADIIHLFGVLFQASLPEEFIITLAKMVDAFLDRDDRMNARGCYPTVSTDHIPVLVRYVPIRYSPELHGHLTHMAYVTPRLTEALVDGGDDLHSYQSYATNPITSWKFLADIVTIDERAASMYTIKKTHGVTLRDIINRRDMRDRMLNGAYADVVIV